MDLTNLGNAIALHLEEVTGLHTNVHLEGHAATLRGRVPSVEARQALLDLAAELAPRWRLVDELEVDVPIAEAVRHMRIREGDELLGIEREQLEPSAVEHEDIQTDAFADGQSGEPFTPAMDPVIGLDHRGRPEIVGGFGLSSLDEVDVAGSANDPLPGDEALAEAVRRELREDAATTALTLTVEVRERVVTLVGTVDGHEDVEAAETVVWHVPGVVDVYDEIEIRPLARERRRRSR